MNRARSLSSLGIAADPLSSPLTYPGLIPTESGLMIDDLYLTLTPERAAPLREWPVGLDGGSRQLDSVLGDLGEPLVGARTAVVCIGSNAAPAQMYVKLTRQNIRPVIPMVRAQVRGIRPGVSAYVSRPGYIPATPVADPHVVSTLVVVWLDEAQLAAVDRTEPNYRRVILPPEVFPVTLPSGLRLPDPWCYLSRHGCLTAGAGAPRVLQHQETLINELLTEVPGLRKLCGATPLEWLARTADHNVREAVRVMLRAGGFVLHQEGLTG
jgi:hypothetical protein